MLSQKADFIDDSKIMEYMKKGEINSKNKDYIKNIIEKSKLAKGLTVEEISSLLFVEDETLLDEIYTAAKQIKQKIYGNRIVLFAPLYVSNYCVNACKYCGFKCSNNDKRKKLTKDELIKEVEILESLGHKRLALEAGEDDVNCNIDYILDCIKTIYKVHKENGAIRRVNVNIAATTVENYKKLKKAGIGTYILFQETYHKKTYEKVHPKGPKHNYDYHTTAMDRAMTGGIDDVGMGVLFGLYDYRYEVIAMFMHSRHLEKTFGVGPHTISVPRLRPAGGVDFNSFPYLVNDHDFKKLVGIIRLAVPYTGMILSTREPGNFRDEVISVGISQVSAGSCTDVGGYEETYGEHTKQISPQFELCDKRSPIEILKELCKKNYIPSYCTACYRKGRTGERFMSLAKTANIHNVCLPNALLTFKEFLMDYADTDLKVLGEKTINENLKYIDSPKIKEETIKRLNRISLGTRDLYF